jgi:hypothetical protein
VGFSGLFATGGPIYVIIIQNEANDIKTFRATMFALGLVTVMRIPSIWRLCHGANFTSICVAFYSLILGKKVYLKLDDVLIKKIILGLLFISGYVIDKLVTDSVQCQ